MSLFDALRGQMPQMNMQQAMQQAVQQIKSNPAATLKQAGYNVPEGMTDSQQIINYLLQSGQLPQNRLTMAMQMAQRMGLRR